MLSRYVGSMNHYSSYNGYHTFNNTRLSDWDILNLVGYGLISESVLRQDGWHGRNGDGWGEDSVAITYTINREYVSYADIRRTFASAPLTWHEITPANIETYINNWQPSPPVTWRDAYARLLIDVLERERHPYGRNKFIIAEANDSGIPVLIYYDWAYQDEDYGTYHFNGNPITYEELAKLFEEGLISRSDFANANYIRYEINGNPVFYPDILSTFAGTLIPWHEITLENIEEYIYNWQPSMPALTFSQLDLTPSQLAPFYTAIAPYITGDIVYIYHLSNDLYYIITTDGAAIVAMRAHNTLHVLESGSEFFTEQELMPYIIDSLTIPNVSIDFSEFLLSDDVNAMIDHIKNALLNINGTIPNDPAIRDIVRFAQDIISTASFQSIPTIDNRLSISAQDIESTINVTWDTYNNLMSILQDITLDRPIDINIIINGMGLNPIAGNTLFVALDSSIATSGASITIVLGDNQYMFSIQGDDLNTILQLYGGLTITIEQTLPNIFIIQFFDSNNNIISQLPTAMSFVFPAASSFETVFATIGDNAILWGSQFFPLTNTLLFGTSFSGVYEIKENFVQINDILHLSDDIQKAIQFMVSQQFFTLPADGFFDPNGTMTRYTFASTLVRMFFGIDWSTTSSFTDVPVTSPYYLYIASGEHLGLVEGIGRNRFAGDRNITKQETLVIVARTLVNERNHTMPSIPEQHLSLFNDRHTIAP